MQEPIDLFRKITLTGVVLLLPADLSFLRLMSALLISFLYSVMLLIVMFFDPARNVRTSFGQPAAAPGSPLCGVKETSFWGAFERMRHVCTPDPGRDLFTFDCPAAAAAAVTVDGSDWHTSCGTPRSDGLDGAIVRCCAIVLGMVMFCTVVRPAAAVRASSKQD